MSTTSLPVCVCVCVACVAMLLSVVLNRGLVWPLPIPGFKTTAVCIEALHESPGPHSCVDLV